MEQKGRVARDVGRGGSLRGPFTGPPVPLEAAPCQPGRGPQPRGDQFVEISIVLAERIYNQSPDEAEELLREAEDVLGNEPASN